MNLILLLLQASRVIAIGAVVLGVVSGASAAALIAVVSTALVDTTWSLGTLAVTFILLAAISAATRLGSQLLLLRLAHDAIFSMRMRLSRQILATPLEDIQRIGGASMLATLTDDVAAVTDAVMGIAFLLINGVTIVGCLAYLAWLSMTTFLAVVVLMIVGAVTYQILQQRAVSRLHQARMRQDALMGHFRTLGDGAKELKLNVRRRQSFLDTMLAPTAQAFRQEMVRGMGAYILGGTWAQLLLLVLIGALVFGWPREDPHSAALLTSYALTLLYMLRPMDAVLQLLPYLGRATVAMKKIESLGLELETELEPNSLTDQGDIDRWQRIELQGVVRGYASETLDDRFVLGPIDLTLSPGEIVFITGGNGSGKSTLVNVLVGLYEPEQGEIRLDGKAIDKANLQWYREHFAVVFSDYYLFDRLLDSHLEDRLERVQKYLVRLHLDRKVKVVGDQLQSDGLSQGQRRRLALLMSYLDDRPIYVFDEWAADQDPAFKEVFYSELVPELRDAGKCVVVISHDDRYYHLADRLVMLESGTIIPRPVTDKKSGS